MGEAPSTSIAPIAPTDDGRFSAAVAAVASAFGDDRRRGIYLYLRAHPGADTAHGFATHAEDRGATTAVVAEQYPFGDVATANPVLCAVDRGVIQGLLTGLCGTDEPPAALVLSSRARGDTSCGALA